MGRSYRRRIVVIFLYKNFSVLRKYNIYALLISSLRFFCEVRELLACVSHVYVICLIHNCECLTMFLLEKKRGELAYLNLMYL